MKGVPANPCPGSYVTVAVDGCTLNGLGEYVATCRFCKRNLIVRRAHESKPEITTGTIPRHNRKAAV